MSLFENYLTLGYSLAESERLAIYKYLLKTRRTKYENESGILISNKSLCTSVANGEILYEITSTLVSYKARKIGDSNWSDQIRTLKLPRFRNISRRRLNKFFAQAETDVIRNYPVQMINSIEERSFARNVYPYYTLDYFSNGQGKLKGLLMKLRTEDDPLLERLLAS